ncbi:MAG TPA: prepilin-type N-terminal cleavage/methylation domain-containing protein [Polyangiales bacterium]|nr:prepilin-type N-terminal cleavage/methylation domain-containing protein [Polyangiales bacterium]
MKRAGFTLLEVMLAVAIMAISLAAVFSAEAGSVKMATRARKLSFATLLARCKMGELEEDLMKKGLPAAEQTDTDECCKDAPIDGFKCRSEVVPIVLPDSMFAGEEDEDGKGKAKKAGATKPGATSSPPTGSDSASSDSKGKGGLTGLLGAAAAALGGNKEGESGKAKDSDSKDKDSKDKDGKDKKPEKEDPQELLSGDPSRFLSGGGGDVDGISAMAMQYVYPILKPSIQSQIRRVSVTVEWAEGSADKTYDLTQYFVAEQPVPLATDPNDPNGTGVGTGTGTGTGTTGTKGTGTSAFGFTQ